MTGAKGGDDPTRHKPGGSRTETKITEASEMGSDNGADAPPLPDAKPTPGKSKDR